MRSNFASFASPKLLCPQGAKCWDPWTSSNQFRLWSSQAPPRFNARVTHQQMTLGSHGDIMEWHSFRKIIWKTWLGEMQQSCDLPPPPVVASPDKMPIASFSDPRNRFSCQTLAKRRKPWGNNTNVEDSGKLLQILSPWCNGLYGVGFASNSHGVRAKNLLMWSQKLGQKCAPKNVHIARILPLSFLAAPV